MYTLAEIDKIISNGIGTLDLKGEPEELYRPIEYTMSIGGKRIRPRLALLALLALFGRDRRLAGVSCAGTGNISFVYPYPR